MYKYGEISINASASTKGNINTPVTRRRVQSGLMAAPETVSELQLESREGVWSHQSSGFRETRSETLDDHGGSVNMGLAYN